MGNLQGATKLAVLVMLATTVVVAADARKEYRFTVGARPTVSISNQYGPVSVKTTSGNQIVVTATVRSDKVEIDKTQNGNRVDIVSHLLQGADANSGSVEYEVLLPADSCVTLQSTNGPLSAEGLRGDLNVEGANAKVDVKDVSGAHVHVNTLTGAVTLTNIQNGHVEITSVGGAVVLHAVNGPLVHVSSSSGAIQYDGDFGAGGDYALTSHTGNIEATAPSTASIDVSARSMRGQVENDFPLEPKPHTSFLVNKCCAFVGTAGLAASKVVLHSISGKIRLKSR